MVCKEIREESIGFQRSQNVPKRRVAVVLGDRLIDQNLSIQWGRKSEIIHLVPYPPFRDRQTDGQTKARVVIVSPSLVFSAIVCVGEEKIS